MEYLARASKEGVRNIEMESLQFGAFCNKINVRSVVICVALLNRLDGDQVTSTMEQLKSFEERPVDVIIEFINKDY
jgi:uridine phosphorylase